jgi:hypothetical protein
MNWDSIITLTSIVIGLSIGYKIFSLKKAQRKSEEDTQIFEKYQTKTDIKIPNNDESDVA